MGIYTVDLMYREKLTGLIPGILKNKNKNCSTWHVLEKYLVFFKYIATKYKYKYKYSEFSKSKSKYKYKYVKSCT